jgi:hypothetical protein
MSRSIDWMAWIKTRGAWPDIWLFENDFCKELPACPGKIQNLIERKLGLEEQQFIAAVSSAVFGPEWMRQAGEAFANHRIDFFASEQIT